MPRIVPGGYIPRSYVNSVLLDFPCPLILIPMRRSTICSELVPGHSVAEAPSPMETGLRCDEQHAVYDGKRKGGVHVAVLTADSSDLK